MAKKVLPILITVAGIALAPYTGGASLFIAAGLNAVLAATVFKPKTGGLSGSGITTTSRNPIAYRRIIYGQRRVGGTVVFMETRGGSNNEELDLVVALAGHEIESVEEIYFGDELVWTPGGGIIDRFIGTSFNFLTVEAHTGTAGQSASTFLLANNDSWDAAKKLSGIAYVVVSMFYHSKVFVSGIPNMTFVVKGKKVFDPRDSSTVYSSNAALCIRDFLTDDYYGFGASSDEIDDTSFVTGANLCDEAVNLDAGGTENRYELHGVLDTNIQYGAAIESMLTSMGARITYTGGKFKLINPEYNAPTLTLDETHVRGPIQVQTRRSRHDAFNGVRGVFTSTIDNYVEMDYPPIISSTFEAEDGEPIYLDLPLAFTTSGSMAQRLAKVTLLHGRSQITTVIPLNLAAMELVAGDTVAVTNERFGWSAKAFEVQSWTFVTNTDGALGIDLSLSETSAALFDWTSSEEQEHIAGIPTTLPDGLSVAAPTDLTLTSGNDVLFLKTDGTVVSRIKVEWTVADFFADRSEVQFKAAAASDWETIGLIHIGQTTAHIWDVEDGISYDVRVRSISVLGVFSDWLTGSHTVAGKSTAPPDVTTFNVTRMADGTRRFVWTATPPVDVTSGGGFKIKYVSGSGGVWAGMTELHTGLLASSPYETNELLAGDYTFGLKMIDSSGNESDNAVIIEATLGEQRLRDVLISRDERALDWPGTLVDCFVNFENIIESEGNQTWADLPSTWSALPDSWLSIVDSKTPITYTTPTIDMGADLTFTPIVSVDPIINSTVTMQVGTDSDGAPVGSFVALATVTKRYIKIKVSQAATDPFIQSLVTLIDGETQFEDYEDVDTSAATAGRFERIVTGHFKLATRGSTSSIISATIRAFQNAGSGWTWDLISKATTITADSEPAAEFKIYKDGTLTDATIDAEIKGPKK